MYHTTANHCSVLAWDLPISVFRDLLAAHLGDYSDPRSSAFCCSHGVALSPCLADSLTGAVTSLASSFLIDPRLTPLY